MQDMNESLNDILDEYEPKMESMPEGITIYSLMKNSECEEFRLYYVASTRAKHSLTNATHLHSDYVIQ